MVLRYCSIEEMKKDDLQKFELKGQRRKEKGADEEKNTNEFMVMMYG